MTTKPRTRKAPAAKIAAPKPAPKAEAEGKGTEIYGTGHRQFDANFSEWFKLRAAEFEYETDEQQEARCDRQDELAH